MTPHKWDALAVVLSVAALVTCVRLGWVWGRARLRADLVPDLNRRLDAAYDEGWDDCNADQAHLVVDPEPASQAEVRAGGPVPELRSHDAVSLSGLPAQDWLTATREQLSPEHIQDLPGSSGPASRAGGLHWWEEAPLPAVLGLGQEFSGDDKTFARWQVRRWEFRRQCGLPALEAA